MYSTAQSNISAVLVYCNHPRPPSPTVTSHRYVGTDSQTFLIIITSERTLDAPDLVDDYYLNLIDWGSRNTVYLWDTSSRSTSELVTVDDEGGPVTNISWASDGRHVAVGLNNSEVQLWDSTANRLGESWLKLRPSVVSQTAS
ncbi:hypothetical protein SAY87_016812 [Trapa incisa]|uniref:Anaphase-promoting complex subunit 4 WD40 domain-containing protein n=1 Tax=Trapa incisa TaxID=236973 RepID=A0AAN7QXU1_9MYRT|nr:hypothetical protein SAY87_016812 [Trapa incisa]